MSPNSVDLEDAPRVSAPFAMQEQLSLAQEEYNELDVQVNRGWKPRDFPKNQLPRHLKVDPFLWRLFKRLHYEDRNVLILVIGDTGAGKSDFAINIANKIDVTPLGNEKFKHNFIVKCDKKGKPSPDTRIVFSASDFIRLVRSGLPKGSAIVWDEAGIGNDNTRWYEKKAQLVKYVFQTFRKRNYAIFMTVPDRESITVGVDRLTQIIADVYEREANHTNVSVLWQQRNRKSSGRGSRGTQVYSKHTAYYDEESGMNTKVAKYMVEPCSRHLRVPYDKIKDYILGDLYAFAEKEMREMERLEKDVPEDDVIDEDVPMRKFDIVKCMQIVDRHVKEVLDVKGSINKSKIVYLLGKRGFTCSDSNAKTIKDNLE